MHALPLLSAPLLAELEAAYREPQRHYHTQSHIDALLSALQTWRHLAREPALIEAAIWFHDAVYDPRRDDNEERSAQWAARALAALDWPEPARRRVAGMVRATARHSAADDDVDTTFFLDLDLSVLGQSPAVYEAYAAGVRAEYAWVDAPRYAAGRAAVLRGFLARPAIFHTPALHAAWEDPARRNLAREIETLERQVSNDNEEDA